MINRPKYELIFLYNWETGGVEMIRKCNWKKLMTNDADLR